MSCITRATLRITTVFNQDAVVDAIFGSGHKAQYDKGIETLQKHAENDIFTHFREISNFPLDQYGNAVLDPVKRVAYESSSLPKTTLLSNDVQISNVFKKFAVDCATCDEKAVCLPASSELHVRTVSPKNA